MADARVGDVGVILLCSTGLDLTNAVTKQIRIKRPDATLLTKTATVYGDDTDGLLQYATIATDLNGEGTYTVAARVVFADGSDKESKDRDMFIVKARLA